jgi:glucans biosynthesis protein C
LVVVGLVFFHTAVIFGAGEFPVKADTENPVATVFLGFGGTWGMPLLFLISGMGIWYSLRFRDPGVFARERLRRLGVPLLVGLLTLVPLQVYLGLRRAGDPSSWGQFYARFWEVRPSLNVPFVLTAAPGGVFETGHLWFLVCLLAFSLVLLPGFVFLRGLRGGRLVQRLTGLLARPGGLLLLALPLAAVEVALGGEVGHGGWNHGSYALLLVYGCLAAADPRIGEAFRRLRSVDGWLWVVAVVGLARCWSHRQRSAAQAAPDRPDRERLLRRLGTYANDAVLPFYVLHETVIVVVAYFVLAWPVGGGAQYCLIALVSLAATLLLYDLGVRRSPLTRFLFGLKQPTGHDR